MGGLWMCFFAAGDAVDLRQTIRSSPQKIVPPESVTISCRFIATATSWPEFC